jgi:WD40 repeat protein
MYKLTGKKLLAFIAVLIISSIPASLKAQERVWLGVQVQSLTQAAPSPDGGRGSGRSRAARGANRGSAETGGLLVTGIVKGSPAEKMGLRKGDILLQADEHKLTDPAVLANFVAEMKPGYDIWLTVLRNGETAIYRGKLAVMPEQGRKAVARVPLTRISDDTEIIIQMGHTSGVSRARISPSGKFILSSDGSKTIKLWDMETGKEIRSYSDFDDRVHAIALSADEKYLFAGGSQGALKMLDFESGKSIWSLKGHAEMITSAIFSSDGKYIVTGSYDKTIKIREAATGKEIKTLTGSPEIISAITFSPDEKYILSGGKDGVVRLWDISSGREINSFRSNPGWINALAFSPDGKYVFCGNEKTLIKVWEVSTGREIKSFSISPDDVSRVAFSPDARHVLSVGIDRVFHLWDIMASREVKTFTGHSILIFDTSFSRDGSKIISGSEDHTIKIWDAATGRNLKTLAGNASWVYSANFSPDGSQVISTSNDRTVRLWNIATGRQEDTFRFQWDIAAAKEIDSYKQLHSVVKSAGFSKDGRHILSRAEGEKGAIIIWDSTTGKIEKFFLDKKFILSGGVQQFSPDEKYLISGGEDKIVKLWDVASRQEVKRFVGHKNEIKSVSFSPDGKFALSAGGKSWGNEDNSLRLWDITTGKETKIFIGHTGAVFCTAFSSDGKYIVSGSVDKTVRLWNVASGKEIRTFAGHTGSVSSVVFSPDGKFILSGSGDNLAKLWNTATGKEVKTFSGHTGWINSVAFSPDNKYIVSGSFDGTTRLWSISGGREMARFIGFNDGEWIVITPEGYYNSSQNGHKHLSMRMGNSIYGIDQFYDVFYRPDIVTAKLKGDDIRSLVTLTIDEAIKNPPPAIDFTSTPQDTAEPRVSVCYEAESTGGGIGELRVFHNGKLIQSDGFYRETAKAETGKLQLAAIDSKAIYEEMRSITIKDKAAASPITSKSKGDSYKDCKEIEAVPGENEVSVTAFNSSNTAQSQMKTISFQSTLPAQAPHLYILSIGIDKYEDQSINLKYARKDASDIEKIFVTESATLYQPQNIHHELLANEAASKENIIAGIDKLARVIKPNDGFILFVAGHGVLLHNQYYMLTHDYNGSVNDLSLISSNEIVEMSKKIKSLHQLLIFDTCHAGGVDNIVSGLYDARISVLAKKMGLHIYASANDKQAALDGYKGNGLFTYTLLSGMNNNREADKNNNGEVSVAGLGSYSKKATGDISRQIGHSQTPLIINFGKDYPLYRLQ